MSELAAKMIADLVLHSGQLVEVGLGNRRLAPAAVTTTGTEGVLFEAVRGLTGLVPHLVDELEDVEDARNVLVRRSWHATRATVSRAPRDWMPSGGRVLPRRWLRSEPAPSPDVPALGWLLHLVRTLESEVDRAERRTERHVEEARAARRGTSKWALQDVEGLEGLRARVRSARTSLHRADQLIVRRAEGKLRPTRRSPSPFPRGRSWWRVRRLASDIADKERTLAQRIAALLSVDPRIADEPVLYQRWCGMRIVETFQALGWSVEGDPIGALYLAGHVTFRKDAASIELWIENRVTRAGHDSGFLCVKGEDVTPDFLLVAPGAGGPDAFVLDATLSTDPDVLADKGKYLDLIQGRIAAMVAGVVAGPRRPMRAWACAPFDLGHCRVATQNGARGEIPMFPLAWNPGPLRAWS